MSETKPQQPPQAASPRTASRLGWLIEPQARRLLLPVCGVWILALDWILFSSNMLSLGIATPIVAAIGFILGAAGTFIFQSKFAGDKVWLAAVKALFAGVVVGAPWPMAGTLIGGWVLLASGLGKSSR